MLAMNYKLCNKLCNITSRELLTPQQHYDWGLRALKTILRGCGNLLQNARKNLVEGGKFVL